MCGTTPIDLSRCRTFDVEPSHFLNAVPKGRTRFPIVPLGHHEAERHRPKRGRARDHCPAGVQHRRAHGQLRSEIAIEPWGRNQSRLCTVRLWSSKLVCDRQRLFSGNGPVRYPVSRAFLKRPSPGHRETGSGILRCGMRLSHGGKHRPTGFKISFPHGEKRRQPEGAPPDVRHLVC